MSISTSSCVPLNALAAAFLGFLIIQPLAPVPAQSRDSPEESLTPAWVIAAQVAVDISEAPIMVSLVVSPREAFGVARINLPGWVA